MTVKKVIKCHLNQKEKLAWTLASSPWLTNQVDKEEEEGGHDGGGLRQCQKEKKWFRKDE